MIKFFYFFTIFFCWTPWVFAQAQTFHTKEGRETKSKAEAYYSRTVAVPAEEGGKPIVEEIYLSTNKPKLRGTYQRKGSYQFVGEKCEFFENGLLKSKENYTNNSTLIDSAFYFHENGRLKIVYFYPSSMDSQEKIEIQDPLVLLYQDSSGVKHLENGNGFAVLDERNNLEQGYYKSHKKVGEWSGTFLNDKYTFTETYRDGELLSGVTKDSTGVETPYDTSKFRVNPDYPGGIIALRKFVAQNYRFPKSAIQNKISGVVQIEFVVEKDGRMSNFVIAKDLGYGTGQAGIAAFKGAKRWSPAYMRGIPVRVKYSLPIHLNL